MCFPSCGRLGGEGSAFSKHMKDARLGIPTPALLAKAVEKLDAVRMDDRDTKGDVYEYTRTRARLWRIFAPTRPQSPAYRDALSVLPMVAGALRAPAPGLRIGRGGGANDALPDRAQGRHRHPVTRACQLTN